jgi:hypothetical protein
MLHAISRAVRRFMRWLFGAPFQELPPGFGEPMPRIRAFEEEMSQIQHRAHGKVPVESVRRHSHAKPTKQR